MRVQPSFMRTVAAASALGLVALFVAWLTFLAWPAVTAGGRLIRLLEVLPC